MSPRRFDVDAIANRDHEPVGIDGVGDQHLVAGMRVLDAVVARLGDRELQIVDLFDVETETACDAGDRKARDAHPLGFRGEPQLDAALHPRVLR